MRGIVAPVEQAHARHDRVGAGRGKVAGGVTPEAEQLAAKVGNAQLSRLQPDALAVTGYRLLSRKLEGPLTNELAMIRLKDLLARPGKRFGPADNSFFERVLADPTTYTFEQIRAMYAAEFGPLPEKLSTLTPLGTRRIVVYRADTRSPGQLRTANPPGFGTRNVTPSALLKASLLKNPANFSNDQVRFNRADVKAYSTEPTAGGYASNDRYLYRVDLGVWTEFGRVNQRGPNDPVILSDTADIAQATLLALDTRLPTKEISLLFELGLGELVNRTEVKVPGGSDFEAVDWTTV